MAEIYLLPQSYKGKVVVAYNRPFGENAIISNDTTYFTIPTDGILIAKSSIKSKLETSIFYQIDLKGNRQPLNVLSYDIIMSSEDSTKLKNQVGVFIFGTIGSCNVNEVESFCYSDFYVGSLNEMPKYYTPIKVNEFDARLNAKAKWRRH